MLGRHHGHVLGRTSQVRLRCSAEFPRDSMHMLTGRRLRGVYLIQAGIAHRC